MDKRFKYALAGIAGFLFLKYVVVGFCQWNSILHPLRQDDPNSLFFYPLLGFVHPTSCDRVTTTISFGSAVTS
jgi:hypothetical protein